VIPISVSTFSAQEKIEIQTLMDNKTLELEIPNAANDEWIKLNPNTVGVYRVQYSSEMLKRFLASISDKSLPPLDRLGLQNDLFAFVKGGKASTVDLLELLDAFYDEDNYTVWNSIISCLGILDRLLSHTEYQPLFHEYSRNLLAKIYSKLGWDPIEGESHLDNLLRNQVIKSLGGFGDKIVIAKAKKLFSAHSEGKSLIRPDLREAVYNSVVNQCDDKTFEALFKVMFFKLIILLPFFSCSLKLKFLYLKSVIQRNRFG
jgi:puromycin-sensitive aminopeptidase